MDNLELANIVYDAVTALQEKSKMFDEAIRNTEADGFVVSRESAEAMVAVFNLSAELIRKLYEENQIINDGLDKLIFRMQRDSQRKHGT